MEPRVRAEIEHLVIEVEKLLDSMRIFENANDHQIWNNLDKAATALRVAGIYARG